MGFLDRLLGRKKGPDPAVMFDSDVKKMDVRNGSFVWLLDRDSGKEFCGDFCIKKVLINLDEKALILKARTKTEKGLVNIPLKEILENLGNKHRYFKCVHLSRSVHVKVFGVVHGNVELTFSAAKILKKAAGPKVKTKGRTGKSPSENKPECLEPKD
jgi:hypothetical protein